MSLDFDPALIRKYDRPVPRYTSYPTALQFRPDAPHEALLAEAAAGAGPLSLYVHLPFCETLCWFCACSTVITRNRNKADPYVDALLREMDLHLPRVRPGRVVESMHFGGGSPNFLTADQLRRLCEGMHRRFTFAPDAACSVEIEPRVLDEAQLPVLRQAGFRRASFGIQDADPDVQHAIHRVQPVDMNRRTMDWLRAHGFDSVNIDLVYGLPMQTVASFDRTLDHVLSLEPDRVAVFNYAHVPWMKPAQKNLLRAGPLPAPERKVELLTHIIARLTGAGYAFIGMDHFARQDDELARAQAAGTLQRNFQGYSTHAGAEIAAFGVTAISQTRRSYRQNVRTLDAYYAALDGGRAPIERGLLLGDEDMVRREVIMRIMCDVSIEFAALSRAIGGDFATRFAAEIDSLADLEADGLLRRHPGRIEVTPLGRLLVRNIALRFDPLFKPGETRHSKAV